MLQQLWRHRQLGGQRKIQPKPCAALHVREKPHRRVRHPHLRAKFPVNLLLTLRKFSFCSHSVVPTFCCCSVVTVQHFNTVFLLTLENSTDLAAVSEFLDGQIRISVVLTLINTPPQVEVRDT